MLLWGELEFRDIIVCLGKPFPGSPTCNMQSLTPLSSSRIHLLVLLLLLLLLLLVVVVLLLLLAGSWQWHNRLP